MAAAAQVVDFPSATPSLFRPGRVVGIRYTPFSVRPNLEQTLYGPTVERAVHELADMLKRHAGELTPRALQLGSVAILARMPKTAAPELKPGTLQPLAFVEGLTKGEIEIGLAKIQRWDWTLETR
jgi:hypothetical protein